MNKNWLGLVNSYLTTTEQLAIESRISNMVPGNLPISLMLPQKDTQCKPLTANQEWNAECIVDRTTMQTPTQPKLLLVANFHFCRSVLQGGSWRLCTIQPFIVDLTPTLLQLSLLINHMVATPTSYAL